MYINIVLVANKQNSVQSTHFFKMATNLGHRELANAVTNADHAGILKHLSKDMVEDHRS